MRGSDPLARPDHRRDHPNPSSRLTGLDIQRYICNALFGGAPIQRGIRQMRAVPSALAEAMRLPSGKNATPDT